MSPTACPVCQSTAYESVLSLPQLPVLVNAQVRPEEAPHVPRGDIELVVCTGCGHLYNRAFDATLLDYSVAYENTLHYSPQFEGFARALAARLVADHSLVGATVAELGSGPGHFLSMLCEAGVGRAFGYDPSYDPKRLGAPEHAAVSISTDAFPADGSLHAHLALSQHVLEHLEDPISALVAERAAIADTGGSVYAEVPNGRLMTEKCALWDLVYEHLSYYVPTSLTLACNRAGLEITRIGSDFDDQFLWCEAVAADFADDVKPDPDDVGAAIDAAAVFGLAAADRVRDASHDLARWVAEGPVALWGAGSKGMTYLNLVADVAQVAAVVDINPRKIGFGVPGTKLTISAPEALTDLRPQTVLAANPIYVDEISARLDALQVRADVVPLWS